MVAAGKTARHPLEVGRRQRQPRTAQEIPEAPPQIAAAPGIAKSAQPASLRSR